MTRFVPDPSDGDRFLGTLDGFATGTMEAKKQPVRHIMTHATG